MSLEVATTVVVVTKTMRNDSPGVSPGGVMMPARAPVTEPRARTSVRIAVAGDRNMTITSGRATMMSTSVGAGGRNERGRALTTYRLFRSRTHCEQLSSRGIKGGVSLGVGGALARASDRCVVGKSCGEVKRSSVRAHRGRAASTGATRHIGDLAVVRFVNTWM